MTANQATYAAILAQDDAASVRTYAARARKSSGQHLSKTQSHNLSSASHRQSSAPDHDASLPADTRKTGSRSLHPGDVIFWAACLGGAFLLLLSATR